jgi:hypothetical protein
MTTLVPTQELIESVQKYIIDTLLSSELNLSTSHFSVFTTPNPNLDQIISSLQHINSHLNFCSEKYKEITMEHMLDIINDFDILRKQYAKDEVDTIFYKNGVIKTPPQNLAKNLSSSFHEKYKDRHLVIPAPKTIICSKAHNKKASRCKVIISPWGPRYKWECCRSSLLEPEHHIDQSTMP